MQRAPRTWRVLRSRKALASNAVPFFKVKSETNAREIANPWKGYGTLQKGYTTLQKGYAALHKGYATLQKGYATLQKGYATLRKGYGYPLMFSVDLPSVRYKLVNFWRGKDQSTLLRQS